MKSTKRIKIFKDFFDKDYMKTKLFRYVNKGRNWVKLNFSDVLSINMGLADDLLEEPEETIKAANLALESMDLGQELRLRIFNLPKTQQKHIWEIRGEDVEKFVALKGVINKSSSILHLCEQILFECPNCGTQTTTIMEDGKYKEPNKCGCGKRGKFKIISKKLNDCIKLGLIDDLMNQDNKDRSVAREKIALLTNDLTCLEIDKMIKPGRQVILNGYFKYIQKLNTTEFESVFFVNSIEFVEVGWETIKISKKEEDKIIELSLQKNIVNRLASSIADVEGFNQAKIASLLLLAGAPNLYDENHHLTSRGTIHILLIGDPGSAKTYLAKRAGAISPICSFQSAATASGRGLVASVSQDKDLGTWAIYPGIVAMAHKGVVVIDEIDKTHAEDYGDHNNAMNDMEVPIAKANVKGRLDTETCYLATANPENRIFTQHDSFYNQIDMPKDFIDRFDIIFPMVVPTSDVAKDKIMDTMLDRHLNGKNNKKNWNPEFDHEFIRTYISYCRRKKPFPEMKKTLFPKIKQQLIDLMRPKGDEQTRVSFRQLESIMRFAYASARLHLRDVSDDDVKVAFELKKKSFVDLGIIDESGGFSWAKIEGVDEQKISNKELLQQVLKELLPDKKVLVEWQKVVSKCEGRGLEEDFVDEMIRKLKDKGDLFEPKSGWLKRM